MATLLASFAWLWLCFGGFGAIAVWAAFVEPSQPAPWLRRLLAIAAWAAVLVPSIGLMVLAERRNDRRHEMTANDPEDF